MLGQKILIQEQNMKRYLKFLIGYSSFWHNQTYKSFFIHNKNNYQTYNK